MERRREEEGDGGREGWKRYRKREMEVSECGLKEERRGKW